MFFQNVYSESIAESVNSLCVRVSVLPVCVGVGVRVCVCVCVSSPLLLQRPP